MEYAIIRSRRKTLSLRVERDLSVSVRAPQWMPLPEIERFVGAHSGWIVKQLDRLTPQAEQRAAFRYEDGQTIPFHGGELRLASGPGGQTTVKDGQLLLPECCDRAKAVAAYFREDARGTVADRIAHFAPGMGVRPAGIKITSAAARWGSCSGKGRLCFSWRIACLPGTLADYIVVHELAHLRELNHSDRFWAVVGGVLPNYAERRSALRAIEGCFLPF